MNIIQPQPGGPRRLRFGCCVLDEGLGSLAAPDGSQTVLRPKTLDLLLFLLRNPGRVVSRNEILDTVWPGLFVTDDSITQCVVEIRKAMGAGGAELLRTIPRRGYLLQAEVAADQPPPIVAPAAPMLSARADDRPSIAVLPFRKDHTDPQEAWFADGIIEGIVHVLSGLDGIFVVSRGSALAFAQQTLDARAAGRELGVRYVLYGGVRRVPGRVRITTELTDAERGTILRADRYDGTEEDLFELQDRISAQVVAAVLPELRQQEIARALRSPPGSVGAYELVLRALDRMQQMSRDGLEEAERLLAQAIAADPDHALAYSYTAWLHVLRAAQGWTDDYAAEFAAAGRAAAAAVERDRRDALALAIRGHSLAYASQEHEQAALLIEQAVALRPGCALAWSFGAALRCWAGDAPRAVQWAEEAVRLSPLDPFAFFFEHILAQAHYTAGDAARAAQWARRSLAGNPAHAPTLRVLAASLAAAGEAGQAAAVAQQLLAVDPLFRMGTYAARTPLRGPVRARFLADLRRAGLPD